MCVLDVWSFRWLGAVALLGGVLVGSGCDTRPRVGDTVPVSGVVKRGDKPLNGGTVAFIPDEGAGNKSTWRTIGIIGSDGKYTLSTSSATDSKPGAPVGKYKVTVAAMPTMRAEGAVPPPPKPGDPVGPMIAPTMSTPIDLKYSNPATSGLSFEVLAGGGRYDLILK